MGVANAFVPLKDCKAIKVVDPKSLDGCHIDGSAVSYMRLKTTEGRLLLKELKKQAKDITTASTPASLLPLGEWDESQLWHFPSPKCTDGSVSQGMSTLHISSPVSTSNNNPSTINPIVPPRSYFGSASSRSAPIPLASQSISEIPTDPCLELSKAREEIWLVLAKVIDKMFDSTYNKSSDFIHYDGRPTVQKAFAHERRLKASKPASVKMSDLLATTEIRLSQMETKSNLSNSQLSRFKKHLGRVVFPHWLKCRGIDPRTTKNVARELQDSHGWRSHVCDGQFDICAGKLAREDPSVTVVTTDSDLMFMGIKELVRFQPRGTRFYSYPIEEILAFCGLESKEQWVAAAVVSLNDYDPSIGRTSFKTAIQAMKTIREDLAGEDSNPTVEVYVGNFCSKKKDYVENVEKSMESFVKLEETPLEQGQQYSDVLDESIRRIVYRLGVLTNRYRQSRKPQSNEGLAMDVSSASPVPAIAPQLEAAMDNIVSVPARCAAEPEAGSTVEPLSDPAATSSDPNAAVKSNKKRCPGFCRYISGHEYGPKAFSSVYTHPSKNTEPIGCKNMTIGRPVPSSQAQDDGEEDDEEDGEGDSFPDDEAVLSTEPAPQEKKTKAAQDKKTKTAQDKKAKAAQQKKAKAALEKKVKAAEEKKTKAAEEKGSKKRPGSAITHAPSKRRVRDEEMKAQENAEQQKDVKARRRNTTNIIGDIIGGSFPLVAMRPGRLESCVFHSVRKSFPLLSEDDHNTLVNHIVTVIRTMARVHSDLLREGLLATKLYIATVFKEFPAIDGERAQADARERSDKFKNILSSTYCGPFFQRLLHRMIDWSFADPKTSRATSTAVSVADDLFEKYKELTKDRSEPPFFTEDGDSCDGMFIEQCARTLSDLVGSHVFKYTLELKKRVIVRNTTWASAGCGKGLLNSIDDKGKSDKHDRLSLHLIMNLMLPAAAQIAILPEVGFGDGFFALTERQLVACLLKDYKLTNKRRSGVSVHDKQARILHRVFGAKTSAENNTQDEVGRLSFYLFLNGQNTSYRRGANVLWANEDLNTSPSSSSSSSPSSLNGSPCILQAQSLWSRMLLEQNVVVQIQEVSARLDDMAPSDSRYQTTKEELRTTVRNGLQSPERYQQQIDDADPNIKRQKYILSGDLSTNGYDLRVMAYKLTEKKRVAQTTTSTQSNVPVASFSSSSAGPPPLVVDDQSSSGPVLSPMEMDRGSNPPGGPEQASREPLPALAPAPVVAPTVILPWSTAPVLKGWPYIADEFNTQDTIDKLHEGTAGPEIGIRVLCLDPGVACTATGTLVHSRYAQDAINLVIPRGPRDVINRRYRKDQSNRKTVAGIPDVEAKLVSMKSVQIKLVAQGDPDQPMEDVQENNTGGEEDQVMEDVNENVVDEQSQEETDTDTLTTAMVQAVQEFESTVRTHVESQAKVSPVLRRYYGSVKFKRDKYDYREAIRHDLDKATTAILKMRHYVPDRQPTADDLQRIIDSVLEDPEKAKNDVDLLPGVKRYDWKSYQNVMKGSDELSGNELQEFQKSARDSKGLDKMARSLFKRGYLGLNRFSDDDRNKFLASPFIIGVGDGDYRKWKGQSHGCGKLTGNLIRQRRNLAKDLARNKNKTPIVIKLVKIPEFRSSVFCCSCHFRVKEEGRSVICNECNWSRDRDHNSAMNLSNAALHLLSEREWPAPFDFAKAKLADRADQADQADNNDA